MSLLSILGAGLGLLSGAGAIGMAIGSGIGTLIGGGSIGDAIKNGVMAGGIGYAFPGVMGNIANVFGASGAASAFAGKKGIMGLLEGFGGGTSDKVSSVAGSMMGGGGGVAEANAMFPIAGGGGSGGLDVSGGKAGMFGIANAGLEKGSGAGMFADMLTPKNILMATTLLGALEGGGGEDPAPGGPAVDNTPAGRSIVASRYDPISREPIYNSQGYARGGPVSASLRPPVGIPSVLPGSAPASMPAAVPTSAPAAMPAGRPGGIQPPQMSPMMRDPAFFDPQRSRFAEKGGAFPGRGGGFIQGPGSGTSDSVPAQVFQGGQPVEQASLSDGEFVMTNRAVEGLGQGDRNRGAAKMYEMMSRFEGGA